MMPGNQMVPAMAMNPMMNPMMNMNNWALAPAHHDEELSEEEQEQAAAAPKASGVAAPGDSSRSSVPITTPAEAAEAALQDLQQARVSLYQAVDVRGRDDSRINRSTVALRQLPKAGFEDILGPLNLLQP